MTQFHKHNPENIGVRTPEHFNVPIGRVKYHLGTFDRVTVGRLFDFFTCVALERG